jgi:hypothetical protein
MQVAVLVGAEPPLAWTAPSAPKAMTVSYVRDLLTLIAHVCLDYSQCLPGTAPTTTAGGGGTTTRTTSQPTSTGGGSGLPRLKGVNMAVSVLLCVYSSF